MTRSCFIDHSNTLRSNHEMMKYTMLLVQMQLLCLECSLLSSSLVSLSLWHTSYTPRENCKVRRAMLYRTYRNVLNCFYYIH